jgi:aspartate-semialdehyde dehydrogenase
MQKLSLAIVGATGLVGENILSILAEKKIPIENLYLIASAKSAGEIAEFKNKSYIVEDIADFDFSKANYAIFSAGKEVAKNYAPKAVKQGCFVIDNSSAFRYDDNIPLVIPEINADTLQNKKPSIIANPNCSTIQLLMAVKPIFDAVGVDKMEVVTYQSVSGAGKEGLEELVKETSSMLNGRSYDPKVFPEKIAFNIIPQIDVFEKNGYTREEMKIVWETKKILSDSSIKVNPTAARVPVFYGHSMAVHLETKKKISVTEARKLMNAFPGVKVIDKRVDGGYPTAVSEASGKDTVFVGRIRGNLATDKGLNFWVVADNLRKGAALNAIQILECLINA